MQLKVNNLEIHVLPQCLVLQSCSQSHNLHLCNFKQIGNMEEYRSIFVLSVAIVTFAELT